MAEQNSIFSNIDVDLNHIPELQQQNDFNYSSQYFDEEGFNSLCIDDKDLRILHLNIRSLCSCMKDLCALLTSLKVKFDIICITESWLSDHTEPLYSLPGYNAYHSLRPVGKRGGGISVFISHGYSVNRMQRGGSI